MKCEDDMVVFSCLLQVINMNDIVVTDSINYSTEAIQYVTLEHKINRKGLFFFEIEIYTSSES